MLIFDLSREIMFLSRKSLWGQEQLCNLVNSEEFEKLSTEDLVSKLESMMGNKCSNWPDPQIIKQSGWLGQ